MILDNVDHIALYRFKTLIVALKLEIEGMRMNRGPTAYSILKREKGYTGNKIKVLELAQADYEREKMTLFPLS